MPKFRIVLKAPATTYAYHDIEANSIEELATRLQSQEAINDIVGEGEGHVEDISEINEDAEWSVDELCLGVDVIALKINTTKSYNDA